MSYLSKSSFFHYQHTRRVRTRLSSSTESVRGAGGEGEGLRRSGISKREISFHRVRSPALLLLGCRNLPLSLALEPPYVSHIRRARRGLAIDLFTIMDALPTVLLKPGEADRIVAGHPWIYHGSVLRLTHPAADGELVQVKDHRQRFLGVGFYNSKSKINVRVLSPERVEVNQAFFEDRIRTAFAVRQRHLPKATSFRVVNAESDFLSGLIVDKYEDVLVVQISSLGMDQRKSLILAALQSLFSPRAIFERSDVASRRFEGLAESNGVLAGAVSGPVLVELNGLEFETDLLAGHKTGLYLDQQVNYQRVAELVKGGQVLDAFSFLGGFGLHAARAGDSPFDLFTNYGRITNCFTKTRRG